MCCKPRKNPQDGLQLLMSDSEQSDAETLHTSMFILDRSAPQQQKTSDIHENIATGRAPILAHLPTPRSRIRVAIHRRDPPGRTEIVEP